jgi:hypothetical protein
MLQPRRASADAHGQVLILLPFRNAALGVVLRLAALAQAETRTDSLQHKDRFVREFGDEDDTLQVRPRHEGCALTCSQSLRHHIDFDQVVHSRVFAVI